MDFLMGEANEIILIIISIISIIIAVWIFGLKIKFKAGNFEINAEKKEPIKKEDNKIDMICRFANEKFTSFNVQLHEHYVYLMSHKAKYIEIKNLQNTKEAKLVDVFYRLWKDEIINDLRETLLSNDFDQLTYETITMLKLAKSEFWIDRYVYLTDEYWVSDFCSVMRDDFISIINIKFKHVYHNIVDEIFGVITQK